MEYALSFGTGALIIPVMLACQTGRWHVLLSCVTLLAAIPVFRAVFTQEDGDILNHALAATGKCLLLFSLFFLAGWLL